MSAAHWISSPTAFSAPKEIFSSIVSENRNVSCGTKPMLFLNVFTGMHLISLPSTSTAPSVASINRGIKLINVVFPLPVGPMMAKVMPGFIFKFIFFKTGFSSYEKDTFSNSISPLSPLMEWSVHGVSWMSGSVSIISLSRFMDAEARWIRFKIQPNEMMGQRSMPSQTVNATRLPSVICSLITAFPPNQSRIKRAMPNSTSIDDHISPRALARMRFCFR